MKVINTSADLLSAFDAGRFDMEKWKTYMDAHVPGAKDLCLSDMRACIHAGFSWEHDFLPVLNAVLWETKKREEAVRSFCCVTAHLDEKIVRRFGRTVDAAVVLYLGLCNGAGWVTPVSGRTTVLLGIEKIMELNWCDPDALTGLIVHELGHVYQAQYGILHRKTDTLPDHFLWQLFTEGVAMVFEQKIIGDPSYFHQDRNGWKQWCDGHAEFIRQSFRNDIRVMTRENQRYFGDWTRLEGYGDTGYYLGARFVRFLLRHSSFDQIIRYGIEEVKTGFDAFMRERA